MLMIFLQKKVLRVLSVCALDGSIDKVKGGNKGLKILTYLLDTMFKMHTIQQELYEIITKPVHKWSQCWKIQNKRYTDM